jgi:hypothetical protein
MKMNKREIANIKSIITFGPGLVFKKNIKYSELKARKMNQAFPGPVLKTFYKRNFNCRLVKLPQ